MVREADAGQTFTLRSGTHRGHSIEPKDGMSFVGEPGAILSGAEVLSGFAAQDGVWALNGVIPDSRNHGRCVAGYEGCSLTQDLFMDDVMLWQVTDEDDLETGRWYWDGDAVYIADDPTNRRIELSTVEYAFVGAADDVTIRGLGVEKYATPAQDGAIQSQEPGEGAFGEGWLIEDVDASGNHGAAVRTGNQTVVRNSRLHHNGQLGITCAGGTDVLIENNEIAHNNLAGFKWEWEAGGVKVTRSANLVFRGNSVHHNTGPGLWADIDTSDVLYENNRVVDNTGPGIFYEISRNAVVRDNVVERNGLADSAWLWGAGILVAGSSNVEVYDNVVSANGNGIAGIQQDRGEGEFGPYLLADFYVHDNTVRLGDGRTGIVEDTGDKAVFEGRGNRFETNTYVGPTGRNYLWNNRRLGKEGWIASGQDTNGMWR